MNANGLLSILICLTSSQGPDTTAKEKKDLRARSRRGPASQHSSMEKRLVSLYPSLRSYGQLGANVGRRVSFLSDIVI